MLQIWPSSDTAILTMPFSSGASRGTMSSSLMARHAHGSCISTRLFVTGHRQVVRLVPGFLSQPHYEKLAVAVYEFVQAYNLEKFDCERLKMKKTGVDIYRSKGAEMRDAMLVIICGTGQVMVRSASTPILMPPCSRSLAVVTSECVSGGGCRPNNPRAGRAVGAEALHQRRPLRRLRDQLHQCAPPGALAPVRGPPLMPYQGSLAGSDQRRFVCSFLCRVGAGARAWSADPQPQPQG